MLAKHLIIMIHQCILWISRPDYSVNVFVNLFLDVCTGASLGIKVQSIVAAVSAASMTTTRIVEAAAVVLFRIIFFACSAHDQKGDSSPSQWVGSM